LAELDSDRSFAGIDHGERSVGDRLFEREWSFRRSLGRARGKDFREIRYRFSSGADRFRVDDGPSDVGRRSAGRGGGGERRRRRQPGGADVVMFGSMVKVPAFYIMALPEIKTIDDLRGKSVGVTRFGSSTDFTMRYVLRKQGLEPGKDVTLIQTGDVFAAATMLRTGAIVAAPFSSPANLKAEEAGARVIINMGKAGVYFPHDAFMARRSFIGANTDLVRRFLKAYSESVYRLFTDKELSRRAIAKYTRAADAKTLDTVYQYAVDYVDKIPYNTREGIQEVLKQAAVRNPKAKEAKPEAFYDDRFVKELDSQGFYKQLWK